LLNDYEEGTWTPTIGGLSSGSVTYFNQNATYTKVGNIVSVQFWLRINTATLPVSPSVTIEGLPYVSNADETRPSVLFRTSGLTGVTGVIGAWITQNTSALQLIIANNGGSGPVLGSNLANGAEFDATITYRVSS
jgi:hypothetical protein